MRNHIDVGQLSVGKAAPYTTVDALFPPETAEKAERIGADKTRLDALSLLALSVRAGAFVPFGALFSLIVTAGAEADYH